MAHKGEAQVRFNGLEAVNGDGLAVAGAAPKKAPSAARFAVQSRIDAQAAKASAGAGQALRQGSSKPIKVDEALAAAAEEAEDETAEAGEDAPVEDSREGSTETLEATTTEAPAEEAKTPDDELASLLASLDEKSAPSSDEAAAEAPMDPELADLLKSLG